jgi:hypothetical protein
LNADPRANGRYAHAIAGEFAASAGSSPAPIVTPLDFHFVLLNPGVALPLGGVKASVPIHTSTHEDEEVEAVLRGAAGRLVRLYLPTYSPWLNSIEMLWRQFRREVMHCELFATLQDLLATSRAFFDRCNNTPDKVRTIIGAHPT